MSRLKTTLPENAQEQLDEIYAAIKQSMGGIVPNVIQGLGNSPEVLKAYLQTIACLAKGNLSGSEREVVALVLSQDNRCEYCLAAHTMMGGMQGLSPDQMRMIRCGDPLEPKLAALVKFVHAILSQRGAVSDQELVDFRSAGYSDAQVPDVVLTIAMTIFTNHFNHVHQTVVDFPTAESV
jgi:uncharacterized peroxidase-related enzyme